MHLFFQRPDELEYKINMTKYMEKAGTKKEIIGRRYRGRESETGTVGRSAAERSVPTWNASRHPPGPPIISPSLGTVNMHLLHKQGLAHTQTAITTVNCV